LSIEVVGVAKTEARQVSPPRRQGPGAALSRLGIGEPSVSPLALSTFAKTRALAARSRPTQLGSGRALCETRCIAERYQRPGWFTERIFNRAVAALTRLGLSVAGSRVLEVRGRKSGEPRRTPVNLLTVEGTRYLVAARGHTHWVRNLRTQGEGRLLLGRRAEHFTASELADEDKPALLRAYLKRWKWEVGGVLRRGWTRLVRR